MHEFGNQLTSNDVHRKLSGRTKKSDETLQQYLLTIKEIGMHENIEEDAIIDYIIAGVPGREVNKVILYYTVLLSELKIKLELSAKMKSRMQV